MESSISPSSTDTEVFGAIAAALKFNRIMVLLAAATAYY